MKRSLNYLKFCILLFLIITFCCIATSIASIAYGSSDDFRKRSPQKEETFTEEDDVRAEIVFGRELAARIIGRYSIYQDKDVTRYVNLVGKGLSQYTNRPEIEFRFAVLDTDIVNAYAAPGGYIFITKGALKVMDDEAELAGVLAHEIAHISQRHIVKELNIKGTDESAVAGLAKLIGGTTETLRGVFTQMVDEAVEILFEKGMKKNDELDSDRLGTMIISAAGYDPSALSRYLKKVSINDAVEKADTGAHPLFKERIEKIDALLVENNITDKKQQTVNERFRENVRLR